MRNGSLFGVLRTIYRHPRVEYRKEFEVCHRGNSFGKFSSQSDERYDIPHFLVSPGPSGRLRSDVQNQIFDLRGVVKNLTDRGHVPYICLDMIAMDEFELSDPNVEFTALVTALQEFGGIVERSDTFWAERIQHAVQWDPTQGVVTERPKTVSSKDPSDSLDASTSSEETVMKHFDFRKAPLPAELIL